MRLSVLTKLVLNKTCIYIYKFNNHPLSFLEPIVYYVSRVLHKKKRGIFATIG